VYGRQLLTGSRLGCAAGAARDISFSRAKERGGMEYRID